MKLVITGGHHSSALPVINRIKEKKLNIDVLWVGHKHSFTDDVNENLEYKEITSLGIEFYELNASKVYKKFNPKILINIPKSILNSLRYLYKNKPDLILSFGGFLAVPVVIGGWFLGIPTITHEQTAVTGYANRVIALFAKRILVSWKESEKYFPAQKVIFSGIPLRESLYTKREDIFVADNLLPYIYITAGKTGSVKFNDVVLSALPELLMYCNVIMQCGDYSETNHYQKISEQYAKIKHGVTGKLFLRKFVMDDEIGTAFSRAALVVSRAGAHTISEILALRKPALLIPIPWVSHNEQVKNAQIIVKNSLGEIMKESDLTGTNLVEKVKGMLRTISRYDYKGAINYKEVSRNAADVILQEVLKYAPKK